MGYESKLYICRRIEAKELIFNEVLTAVNMCTMDSDFRVLFKNKLDGDFLGMDSEKSEFGKYEELTNGRALTDDYGDELKYASLTDVLNWCDKHIDEDYWRITVLREILFTFKWYSPIDLDKLIVVHYGY